MRYLIILLLVGCSSFDSPKIFDFEDVRQNNFKIKVVELPDMTVQGRALYIERTNTCVIMLKKYPVCLQHEMLHYIVIVTGKQP